MKTRMLNATLCAGKNAPQVVEGGGLVFPRVPLLAKGTWTDSAVGTPLNYGEKVLERDAGNWKASGLWTRHAGRSPRDVTDKVGEVRNQHYEEGAVTGDLFFHLLTQQSRDSAELVKNGIIDAVSVEHGGTEIFNSSTKQYDADSIEFYGLALVERGACETCKIKLNEGTDMDEEQMKKALADLETKLKADFDAAMKVKDDSLAQLSAEKEELSKKLAEFESKMAESSKAAEEKDKSLAEKEARIKELEKMPNPKLPEVREAEKPQVIENPRFRRVGNSIEIL